PGGDRPRPQPRRHQSIRCARGCARLPYDANRPEGMPAAQGRLLRRLRGRGVIAMDNEISEETQAASLLAQFRRARERLHHDGALSTPAVRRRVLALAAEWSIPPADYARLMH